MPVIDITFPPLREIYNEKFIPLDSDNSNIVLLYGGRGSGKSHSTASKLVRKMLKQPFFRGVLLRATYESIKDSQYKLIKDVVHAWGLQHLFTFNVSPLEIRCVNGNGFICRGLDKADKLKSLTDPTDIWIEEANQIDYDAYIASVTSLRTKKAPHLQTYLTFNPECTGDYKDFWIYKTFFVGDKEDVKDGGRSFKGVKTITLGEREIKLNFSVTHSTYLDNRHITDQYRAQLEDLKNTDDYYYSVYTLGEWGTKQIDNPFMTLFSPTKHLAPVKLIPNERIILIIDFNLDPFCANFAHHWYDSKGEHFHIFDEISMKGGSIPKMAEAIIDRYGNYLHLFEVTGDKSGSNRGLATRNNMSLFQELAKELQISSAQFKLPANPQHKVSRAHCNSVLYNHPDFKINPVTCPNTVRDMKVVEANPDGTIKKKDRTVTAQQADHLDNVRYGVNTYLQHWRK